MHAFHVSLINPTRTAFLLSHFSSLLPSLLLFFALHSYLEVRSPGFLHIYKDKKAATEALARSKDPSTSSDSTATVIDLKNVVDFTIPTRKNKDDVCVDLELGHESIRIK